MTATYFNGLFRDKIDFNFLTGTACPPPSAFCGQYVNVNEALAHGAELEFHGRPLAKLSLDGSYTYTSTQILEQPFAFDPLLEPGQPLIRRPKHSGSLLLTYLSSRWGANLGGSFIGRRADSDFLGYGINHAAGYARVDLGGWYAITSADHGLCESRECPRQGLSGSRGLPGAGSQCPGRTAIQNRRRVGFCCVWERAPSPAAFRWKDW